MNCVSETLQGGAVGYENKQGHLSADAGAGARPERRVLRQTDSFGGTRRAGAHRGRAASLFGGQRLDTRSYALL